MTTSADENALERTAHGPYSDTPNHECACYPPSRGYPAYMAKGCRGPSACWVLDELREGATPEGRAKYRARYFEQLKARMGRSPSEDDVTPKLLRSGVPSKLLPEALKPPLPASEAMTAAKSWWSKPRDMVPALVLAGKMGIGKSTAVAWVCVQWARSYGWNTGPTGTNLDPLVWMGPEDMRKIGARDTKAADLCEKASRAHLLVVDDAGHDGDRPSIEALCDVMHERCDRGRTLILTTNLTSTAFRARYGEPLSDRLRARAYAPVLKDKLTMRKTNQWNTR